MNDEEKPKIIIDEDWKSQVETERQKIREESETSDDPAQPEGQSESQPAAMQLPPASFEFLISSIATQAMFAMGQIPDPSTGEPMVDLQLAEHHIDMLEVVEGKTKGNLSIPEHNMLKDALYQLRMGFVAIKKQIEELGNAAQDS